MRRNTQDTWYPCIPRVYTHTTVMLDQSVSDVCVCVTLNIPSDVLNKALLYAAMVGRTRVVTMLHKAGADIHYMNDSPFCIACYNGHTDTVSELLKYITDITTVRGSPLTWAIIKGYTDIVRILVDAGVPVTPMAYYEANRRGDADIIHAIACPTCRKWFTLPVAVICFVVSLIIVTRIAYTL